MTDNNPSEGKEEAVPTSQEIPAEAPEEQEVKQEEEEVQEPTLPESASERTTEQFEKLKSQLAEEKAKNIRGTSVFDSMRPQPQEAQEATQPNPFQQQPQAEEPLVADDGTVDIQKMNQNFQQVQHAQDRAMQAEQRIIRLEEDRQTRESHEAHPELDPQHKDFNPIFFDMVSAGAMKNMVEGGNKSVKQIADEIKTFASPSKKEVEQKVIELKENEDKKQQGPIEEGVGEERQPDLSSQELRERTRQGDQSAIDKRLKNLGIT